jgi:serine/threonine protein kinase
MPMFHTGASMDQQKGDGMVPFPHLDSSGQQGYGNNNESNNNRCDGHHAGYEDDGLGLGGIGIDDIDICFWTEDMNIFARDSSFHVVEGVGVGGFGIVVKVNDMSSVQDFYAMKVISKKKIINNFEQQLNELNTMAKLEQCPPFLQQVYGIYENDSNIYIISEFISGGDLFYHLSATKFNSDQLRMILAELFLAIEFMHSKGIIHRDIKVVFAMFKISVILSLYCTCSDDLFISPPYFIITPLYTHNKPSIFFFY